MQAATGEDVSAEELGGAELHCTTSGKHSCCLWAIQYITRFLSWFTPNGVISVPFLIYCHCQAV